MRRENDTPVYCVTVDIEGHTIFESRKQYAVYVNYISATKINLTTFTKPLGSEVGPCSDALKYVPFPELMAMF